MNLLVNELVFYQLTLIMQITASGRKDVFRAVLDVLKLMKFIHVLPVVCLHLPETRKDLNFHN